jgi:hypothetical protein
LIFIHTFLTKKEQYILYFENNYFRCEECNRNFKTDRTRVHGLMGQSFFFNRFSHKMIEFSHIDLQWRQSTLPIRFGGLGIRRISDICLPAFLSSINGVKKLVSLLLNSKDNELNIHHYDEALAAWGVANENEIPTIPQFQKNWDNINIY